MPVAFKNADESRNSNSLANDANLTFAVLNGEKWVYQMVLYVTVSNGTPGIQIAIGTPASFANNRYHICYWTDNANSPSVGRIIDNFNTSTDKNYTGTADTVIYIFGTIEPTANGNVTLQWAQKTNAPTQTTTILRGSHILANKV